MLYRDDLEDPPRERNKTRRTTLYVSICMKCTGQEATDTKETSGCPGMREQGTGVMVSSWGGANTLVRIVQHCDHTKHH